MKKEHLDYEEMIKTKYSWLVFDLDGTLLNDDGYIEDNIKITLQHFTQMWVHIILATWRWPNDTDKIIWDNKFFTNNTAFSVNYNWSLVRRLSNYGWDSEKSNINEIMLDWVEEIFELISNDKQLKDFLVLKSSWEYRYSDFDKYGITFDFKKEALKKYSLVNDIYVKIVSLLDKHWFNNLSITVSSDTIDIFSKEAWKEKGIMTVSDRLWIEWNSLLRIWDLWWDLWNDYCMLKNKKWLTVNEWDTAVKIYSKTWERLFWQQAIKQIMEDIKLSTSYTINKDRFLDEDFFSNKLRDYSKYTKLVQSRSQVISKMLIKDIQLNKEVEFEEEFDISKIFSFNGAVMFSKEDIQNKKIKHLLKYIVSYWKAYYWRGKIFYFFENFTSNKVWREIENYNDFEDMLNFFFSSFRIIINDFIKSQSYIDDRKTYSKLDYKSFLLILDHVRWFLIKFVHFLSFGSIIWINIKKGDFEDAKNILREVTKKYYEFFELKKDNTVINIEKLFVLLKEYENTAIIWGKELSYDFKFFNRILRGVPEISHPFSNYIHWHLSVKSMIWKWIENPVIIWTHFWGIEIPYVLNYFFEKNGKKIKAIVWVHSSKYEFEGLLDNFEWCIRYDDDKIFDLVKGNDVVITDDGVFSWETILNTWLDLSKRSPKKIHFTTQTFPWDRAWRLYKINWWVDVEFLRELFENGLVGIVPVFVWTSKNPDRLFNIEEQRILNIILKGNICW